ncbi:MAG: tetratricopeptide repeat protein [Bacteroidota bacterium]
MKKLVLLFSLCLIGTSVSYSQDYFQQFYNLFQEGDTAAMPAILQAWKKEKKDDPELSVAYFNYYVNVARRDVITLGQNPKGETVFEVQDTANQENVGYLYGDVSYDSLFLQKGFYHIDKAIEAHPNRLDMRFGKIYMLGQINDYAHFSQEIIEVITQSGKNKNAWTWAKGEAVQEGQEKMLSSIQEYIYQIYQTGNDDLLIYLKDISEAVLDLYPDHVESLSNVSVYYLIQKEYNKALGFLLRAEKLAPEDPVVLANIAKSYLMLDDMPKAKAYYELVVKHGDERSKRFAQSQIMKIDSKN